MNPEDFYYHFLEFSRRQNLGSFHGSLPHFSFEGSIKNQLGYPGMPTLNLSKDWIGLWKHLSVLRCLYTMWRTEWTNFLETIGLALVLDPSSKVIQKISMFRISYLFNEAIFLAHQELGKDKVEKLIQLDFEKVNILDKHKTLFLLLLLIWLHNC